MRRHRRHDDDLEEEHVNHEAWIIPYADMLTLLMGLFLVLWAIGNEDLAKMKQFSESFRSEVGITQTVASSGGFGILDGVSASGGGSGSGSGGTDPTAEDKDLSPRQLEEASAALRREHDVAEAAEGERQQLGQAESLIKQRAANAGLSDAISFRREDRGLVVSIVSDDVMFDPGSADLRADGRRALDVLAAALNDLPNRISIEGHTDDRPISTGRFPSNWELSTARAGTVLRYLVDQHGLDASRLVAGGYAEQRPLEPNDTPVGRARNRRVDIAVLSSVDTGGGKP